MKVYRNEQAVPFGELKEGDVFKHANIYYMKVDAVFSKVHDIAVGRNTVVLGTGVHTTFENGEHVIPVNGAFFENFGESEDNA